MHARLAELFFFGVIVVVDWDSGYNEKLKVITPCHHSTSDTTCNVENMGWPGYEAIDKLCACSVLHNIGARGLSWLTRM